MCVVFTALLGAGCSHSSLLILQHPAWLCVEKFKRRADPWSFFPGKEDPVIPQCKYANCKQEMHLCRQETEMHLLLTKSTGTAASTRAPVHWWMRNASASQAEWLAAPTVMLFSLWALSQQREVGPVCLVSVDSEHGESVLGFECKMAPSPEGLPCHSLELGCPPPPPPPPPVRLAVLACQAFFPDRP